MTRWGLGRRVSSVAQANRAKINRHLRFLNPGLIRFELGFVDRSDGAEQIVRLLAGQLVQGKQDKFNRWCGQLKFDGEIVHGYLSVKLQEIIFIGFSQYGHHRINGFLPFIFGQR